MRVFDPMFKHRVKPNFDSQKGGCYYRSMRYRNTGIRGVNTSREIIVCRVKKDF